MCQLSQGNQLKEIFYIIIHIKEGEGMKQGVGQETLKNRYYKGKQLRSEDFLIEQEYMEALFHRSMVHTIGQGILQGLQLLPHNEKRFQLCAGSGVDEKGNILCVEKDCEVSLLEVEGFDRIQSEQVHVYLEERSEAWAPTFCALSEHDDHMEFNLKRQSWKLQVRNERDILHPEFFDRYILYEDKDVRMTQILPTLFPATASFSLCVEIEKKHTISSLSYKYTLYANDFELAEVPIEGSLLDDSSRIERQYHKLHRKVNFANAMSHVTLSKKIHIQKNGKDMHVSLSYVKDIPIYTDIEDEIHRRCITYKKSETNTGIYLGTIYLNESKRAWKIDAIICPDVKTYLEPLYIKRMKDYLLSMYQYEPYTPSSMTHTVTETKTIHSGIVCLQDMQKSQDCYYSEWLSHGFQASEVMIDLAIQTQEQGEKKTVLIQGDGELFPSQKKKATQIATQTSLQDGIFQIAIKTQSPPLTTFVLWQAHAIQRDMERKDEMQLIRLEPSMVELKPLQTCVFTPVFDTTQHICECTFTLANKESGTIGDDGTYCAPASEGVYQAQATSMYGEVVYAYVKVRSPAP